MKTAKDYLSRAKKYLALAKKGISYAKKNGKIEYAVNGCDKGWLATVLAVNALFIKKGLEPRKLPKTHCGRDHFLIKYGTKELRRIFGRARSILHIRGFYDLDVDYNVIENVLDDVNEFIKIIEKE